jgi:ribonuclease BN (tRNA processing enzyme)
VNIGAFKVYSFSVKHATIPARAFRFEFGQKVITFSGDTTDCAGIRDASEKADLIFMDCACVADEVSDYHLNTTQVGQICNKSRVKKVVLVNQLPTNYQLNMVSQVTKYFNGKVVMARDLLKINL